MVGLYFIHEMQHLNFLESPKILTFKQTQI